MNTSKPYILIAVVVLVAGAIYLINANSVSKTRSSESVTVVPRTSSEQSEMKKEEKSKRYELAKEITTPDGFINTDKVSVSEFVGKKVVLLDFWTYSCINCQRTTPYLNAWYEKYKDKGFVIIGVHTPEFEFEKKYDNVLAAVKKFSIKYPVVLDNDYSTWTAYKNQYWPRKYLIDIDGYIVYDYIGEGGYDETEKKIQELLKERMSVLHIKADVASDISTPTDATPLDVSQKITPELYFGSLRNESARDYVTLQGQWDVREEFAQSKTQGAKIVLHYRAKNVYFVAGAAEDVPLKILQDGKPIQGEYIIRENRLYQLISNKEYGEHVLEIIIQKQGLQAFTFTFG